MLTHLTLDGRLRNVGPLLKSVRKSLDERQARIGFGKLKEIYQETIRPRRAFQPLGCVAKSEIEKENGRFVEEQTSGERR